VNTVREDELDCSIDQDLTEYSYAVEIVDQRLVSKHYKSFIVDLVGLTLQQCITFDQMSQLHFLMRTKLVLKWPTPLDPRVIDR
jgi:hypothetical protein